MTPLQAHIHAIDSAHHTHLTAQAPQRDGNVYRTVRCVVFMGIKSGVTRLHLLRILPDPRRSPIERCYKNPIKTLLCIIISTTCVANRHMAT
jgi:hypothetical protein